MKIGDKVCFSFNGLNYINHDHGSIEKFTPLNTFTITSITLDGTYTFINLDYYFGNKFDENTGFFIDELLLVR